MINTPWNYDILADTLPEILTTAEFNAMTANKYANDSRLSSMLQSVTATVRNYVHWHLASNVECSVTYTFDDLHITRTHHDLLVQLPSRCVTAVNKILIDGHEISCRKFAKQNGTLKIYNVGCYDHFFTIEIRFNSGLTDTTGVKAVIASRVSNALSGNIGISSETAGGVSISYSSAYVAGINPSTLLTADREFLNSYRIEEML